MLWSSWKRLLWFNREYDCAVTCGSTPVNNTQTLCRLHRQQIQGAANLQSQHPKGAVQPADKF